MSDGRRPYRLKTSTPIATASNSMWLMFRVLDLQSSVNCPLHTPHAKVLPMTTPQPRPSATFGAVDSTKESVVPLFDTNRASISLAISLEFSPAAVLSLLLAALLWKPAVSVCVCAWKLLWTYSRCLGRNVRHPQTTAQTVRAPSKYVRSALGKFLPRLPLRS